MLVIIAAISFSVYFNMTNLYLSFKLNFKPFNCVPCLSVWSSVIFYFMPFDLIYFISIIFTSGITGAYLFKLLHK